MDELKNKSDIEILAMVQDVRENIDKLSSYLQVLNNELAKRIEEFKKEKQ